ncbi:MAG: hypothetical protein EMLJLAPB_01185 [Candidatus Argoarchaeum ethanivorans]|uniref:Uncharacterized protein n=1 Tax=Candidatus Argoarchaeum ethanivorans TaxID=2608793 RepID=A0A811TH41_9EURY|nr:MAG: hypothetical protein EMLJLAPB_01185 [Candidatus Argoarchaeum ethanivorans]
MEREQRQQGHTKNGAIEQKNHYAPDQNQDILFQRYDFEHTPDGTVEFSSEITISSKFTAEHTENAKAPENLNND